jgi:hypothetical protein
MMDDKVKGQITVPPRAPAPARVIDLGSIETVTTLTGTELHAQAATSYKLMAAITTDTSIEVNPAHATRALFH